MGSSAGLLRTFTYLGAMVAAAATGAFFPLRADTGGLHGLAVFMATVSVLVVAVILADRSLGAVGVAAGQAAAAPEPSTRKGH